MAMRMGKYAERAQDALRLAAGIIERHGPRLSGGEADRGACAELETSLKEHCHGARQESFEMRPDAFYSIGKIFASVYFAGAIAFALDSGPSAIIGLALMLLGAFYLVSEFALFADSFDFLFRKIVGTNVVGTLEPREAARRQVLVVGHHDSAPIYPFYEKAPRLYPLRLFVPILLFALCLSSLAARVLFLLSRSGPETTPLWMKLLLFVGLAAVAPMFGYFSKQGSPGAGDDLIACAIGIELARIFQEDPLIDTRLVVLFTDGEEAGQKGAKAFIGAKGELLRSVDTIVINIDSIYDYEELSIVARDRNGFTELSQNLAAGLESTAQRLGHRPKRISIPFGGGGTDAGQFARKGIEAACVIAQPTKAFRDEIVFHTTKDMPERISPKAVAATIELVAEFIEGRDGLP